MIAAQMSSPVVNPPQKILVIQPSWVGDAVMATPTLRAIREIYPGAHIAYLMRRYVKEIYTGMPWADQLITYRTGHAESQSREGIVPIWHCDSAAKSSTWRFFCRIPSRRRLVAKMANIPKVVGYERDARSFLLTDKLLPVKDKGKFVPTPIVKYYLGLAHYLGATDRNISLELFVTPAEKREAEQVLARCSCAADRSRAAGFAWDFASGAAQSRGAVRSREMLDTCEFRGRGRSAARRTRRDDPDQRHAKERDAFSTRRCNRAMRHKPIDLSTKGTTLGSLKDIVRRCDLMITNDTGPHARIAASAFGVPRHHGLQVRRTPEWTEEFISPGSGR